MKTISPLISQQRSRLKSESRMSRYVLLGAMTMAVVMFSVFLLTFFGNYPLPIGEGLFANNPERLIGASNFFVATAIGSALKMWRIRQMRIKMLVAEAFVREDDENTGLRLLLEPVFGEAVWQGAQVRDDMKKTIGAA